MQLRLSKGRMFKSVTHTGTYFQGCDHDCAYCWTKFMRVPISHEPRLMQKDEHQVLSVREAIIFLNSAHDTFATCISDEWITAMLRWIGRQHPSNEFYLQSKNIPRSLDFLKELRKVKSRIILGTTIETNDRVLLDRISRAPPPEVRYVALKLLGEYGFRTRVSLEPLYKFDKLILWLWLKDVNPELVEIGLDNYRKQHDVNIPGPDKDDVLWLIRELEALGIKVFRKRSLERWLK